MSSADRTVAVLFDNLLEAALQFGNAMERADTSDDRLLDYTLTAEQVVRRAPGGMTEPVAALAAEAIAHARRDEWDIDNLSGAAEALLAMLAARDMSEPGPPPEPDPDTA